MSDKHDDTVEQHEPEQLNKTLPLNVDAAERRTSAKVTKIESCLKAATTSAVASADNNNSATATVREEQQSSVKNGQQGSSTSLDQNQSPPRQPETNIIGHNDSVSMIPDNNTTNGGSSTSSGGGGGVGPAQINNDAINLPPALNNRRNISNMLIYYGKKLLWFIVIVLTTRASYQGSPKIGRPPKPRHFFPAGSMVSDYPSGSLDAVSAQISVAELSFVLFYAPWCATSQAMRQPFEEVAQFYYREAHFSAINCWQPGGDCRAQYTKIKVWPLLMAYVPKNGLAVLYTGPWLRDPMMRFVASFISPLQRLNDPDDLLEVMTGRDAIVVAFLDLKTDLRYWNIYYETTLKWLFRDPFQEVKFCIVTGVAHQTFGVESTPTLRLYLWNETLEYDNVTWAQTDIENWVAKNMQKVASWLTPAGVKSTGLAQYLNRGPALILFTPRNLLQDSQADAMEMMRQIGMEYYNCDASDWIREMVHEYVPGQRQEHRQQHQQLQSYCHTLMATMQEGGTMKRGAIKGRHHKSVSVTFANLINSSASQFGNSNNNNNNAGKGVLDDICDIEAGSLFTSMRKQECASDIEDDDGECILDPQHPTSDDLRPTSMLNRDHDRRSPQRLLAMAKRRRCEYLIMDTAQSVVSFLGDKPFDKAHLDGVEGLACKSNNTLSLILIDSISYHVFAERLGVDVLNAKQKSAVILIDPEQESTYILSQHQEINLQTIATFMKRYAAGQLKRSLRSANIPFQHTHFYKEAAEAQGSNKSNSPQPISIAEVTSANFTRILLSARPSRALLVFFYTTNCAFCTMMAQHLLQVAHIFRNLSQHHLQIVRIDGEKNDLPWIYTMHEYPALIIFPGTSTGNHNNINYNNNNINESDSDNSSSSSSTRGKQKRSPESRLFPINGRNSVTLDNILGFIIANLDQPLRIYAIELTCAASRKSPRSLQNCLNTLRHEINEAISRSLRQWRRLPLANHRTAVLRRLQLLEAFYLDSFRINDAYQCHACDFKKLENYCKQIVKFWNRSSVGT